MHHSFGRNDFSPAAIFRYHRPFFLNGTQRKTEFRCSYHLKVVATPGGWGVGSFRNFCEPIAIEARMNRCFFPT